MDLRALAARIASRRTADLNKLNDAWTPLFEAYKTLMYLQQVSRDARVKLDEAIAAHNEVQKGHTGSAKPMLRALSESLQVLDKGPREMQDIKQQFHKIVDRIKQASPK